MDILYLLIPLSVVLVFLIAWAFWWSVRSGQFDDLEGPAYRVLMDDDQAPRRDKAHGREPEKDPQGRSGEARDTRSGE